MKISLRALSTLVRTADPHNWNHLIEHRDQKHLRLSLSAHSHIPVKQGHNYMMPCRPPLGFPQDSRAFDTLIM